MSDAQEEDSGNGPAGADGESSTDDELVEEKLANALERFAYKLQEWSNWLFGFLR